MLGWKDPRALRGTVDGRLSGQLKKALGLTGAQQLWNWLPRAYSKAGSGVDVGDVPEGEIVTCIAEVIGSETHRLKKGTRGEQRFLTTVALTDGSGRLTATFFNSPWVGEELVPGARAMFSGKLRYFRGRPQLQHPTHVLLSGAGQADRPQAERDVGELLRDREWIPVYPVRKGITSWRILQAVRQLMEATPTVAEPLDFTPENMVSFDAALRGVHLPGPEGPEPAIRRLKYNEAFTLACVTALRREDNRHRNAPRCTPRDGGLADRLAAGLGFELTAGQREVLAEIAADMDSTVPMSRLLQGEVGSGKTVVALMAMLQAVDSGHQAAFLAPTEVLTVQHARSLTAMLARAGVAASVVAVTGSMPAAARREALLAVVSGQADIVVGTHALLEDTVEFFRLGLAVVDEQHRFGVEQRDRLRVKGGHPHVLVMTATPIPRTIAMTVFGDLEISTLREVPGGPRQVATWVVEERRPSWVTRALSVIREQVATGGRAYVVAPRIEGEGGVLEVAAQLAAGPLAGLRVDVLHGRMAAERKDEAMRAFAEGRTQVLVATTVIEVGVDVPEASVMLIRDAEHFGVSQIHQLRGRVGRGERPGTCFLHTATDDEQTLARLQRIAATSDGFALAELDLDLRQEGDILGAAQSGRGQLRLLDMRADTDIIAQAGREATELVARDRGLAERLVAEINPDEQEFIEKS